MAEEYRTFEIDTKGLCLLCLKDDCSTTSFGENSKSSPFKFLLRYLGINTHKICNFSSSFLQAMDALEDTNIVASFCAQCTATTKTFAKLYQDMEFIRVQLDSCLQDLHVAMHHGGRSQARLDEYRRRMRSRNLFEMFNANVANNLRNETQKKCGEKVDALLPRISLFQRDPNSLATLFGFPSLTGSHRRKIPGPKSKTQRIMGSSNLKNLLTQRRKTDTHKSTQEENILLASLLGGGSDDKNTYYNYTSLVDGKSSKAAVECSEEFVVKVEPIIEDGYPAIRKFHIEDDDDGADIYHDFETESVSAISNCDGQLIGHFLGKSEHKSDSSNGRSTKRSSATESPITVKEGEDFFSCDLCDKSFSSAFSLGGHMHVHKNRPKSENLKKFSTGKPKAAIKAIKKRCVKKKIKCTVCKKVLTSKDTYAAHVKRYHPTVGFNDADKRLKCEVCGKQFVQHTVQRTHMLAKHSRHVFSKYLPAGTTDEQLETAIQGVVAQHRDIVDPNKKKQSTCYGCQFCSQVHPHPSHLRLHLLRTHFDKVVIMLQSLFSENVELGTLAEEESEGIPQGEDSSSFGNPYSLMDGDVSNELGLLEADDGEEEMDQQPPILSGTFSLAENVGSGDGTLQHEEAQINYNDNDPLSM